ncbi:MAG: DUF6770 family protein, partial [Bacteroidota bacterium]
EKTAQVFADNSLGIFAMSLDLKGNVATRKHLSWAGEVSPLLGTTVSGKITGKGHLFFHNFIKTADGKMWGVAENFWKAADGLGIAASILSPGTGNWLQMKLGDFYLFELSSDFSLRKIWTVAKKEHGISPPVDPIFDRPQALARSMRQWFDYRSTTLSSDCSSFLIRYNDEGGARSVESIIKYEQGELESGAMNEQDEQFLEVNTLIKQFPGDVLAADFNAKKKLLELWLDN